MANKDFIATFSSDALWVSNHSGDEVNSTDAVRLLRHSEQQAEEEFEARILADSDEPWDKTQETAGLLAALNLA